MAKTLSSSTLKSIIARVTFEERGGHSEETYLPILLHARDMARHDSETTVSQNLNFLISELERCSHYIAEREGTECLIASDWCEQTCEGRKWLEQRAVRLRPADLRAPSKRAKKEAEAEAEALFKKTGQVLSTSDVNSIAFEIDRVRKQRGANAKQ